MSLDWMMGLNPQGYRDACETREEVRTMDNETIDRAEYAVKVRWTYRGTAKERFIEDQQLSTYSLDFARRQAADKIDLCSFLEEKDLKYDPDSVRGVVFKLEEV